MAFGSVNSFQELSAETAPRDAAAAGALIARRPPVYYDPDAVGAERGPISIDESAGSETMGNVMPVRVVGMAWVGDGAADRVVGG